MQTIHLPLDREIPVFAEPEILVIGGEPADYRPGKVIYSLPYRSLVPSGVDNLLAAGRCISCDREVLAAIRVMPPCFGMGQAAGNAAALALDTGKTPATIDVQELEESSAFRKCAAGFTVNSHTWQECTKVFSEKSLKNAEKRGISLEVNDTTLDQEYECHTERYCSKS